MKVCNRFFDKRLREKVALPGSLFFICGSAYTVTQIFFILTKGSK